MIIRELQLQAFGKFHNKPLSLRDAVNVIEGRNEAGKSTIHAFIGAMFFGLDRNGEDKALYQRYKPWFGSHYGGGIRWEEQGHTYLVTRDFIAETIVMTDETDGTTWEGEAAEEQLQKCLGGLTRMGFANTVSISQMKGTTDETIAAELKENLDNLSRARSLSLHFRGAEERLRSQKESLQLDAQTPENSPLAGLEKECRDKKAALTASIEKGWELRAQQQALLEEKNQAFEAYQQHRDELKMQREVIEKEQFEVRSQQEQWEKTDPHVMAKLQKKQAQIDALREAKKDPLKAFAPTWWPWLVLSVVCLAAGGGLFWLYYQPDGVFWQYVAAWSAIGVGVLCLLPIYLLRHRYQKKKNYYRLLLERQSRQGEYKEAIAGLEEERYRLFKEMSDEQNGEYLQACERFDEAEKTWMQAQWEMKEARHAYEEAYTAVEKERRKASSRETAALELQAIDLAWEHLFKAGERTVATFGYDLKQKAGAYMSTITGGKYTAIQTSDDGEVCLESETGRVPVSRVSRGTMEQVYLCLRLAATDLLSPKVSLPLLLDDTFAYYDDARTESALQLLRGCGHQVVLMTCQSREKALLKKMGVK